MADRINLDDERAKRPPRGESPPRARTGSGAKRSSGGGGSGATAAAARPTLRGDDKKLHDALMRFYGTVSVGVTSVGMMRGDVGLATAGVNLGAWGEDAADAWIELAQQNERVRKMLNGFVQGSAVANLIGAHVAMAVPMLAARGAVPPQVAAMVLKDEAKEAAITFHNMKEAAAAAAAPNGTPQPPAA